ncbi:hypothetical protein ACFQ0Q_27840 [Streptomyces aureus]
MKTAGERCDALVKAAEEQLTEAQAKAKEMVAEAGSRRARSGSPP